MDQQRESRVLAVIFHTELPAHWQHWLALHFIAFAVSTFIAFAIKVLTAKYHFIAFAIYS